MLTRNEVFYLIDQERDYQDENFDPNKVTSSGLTRAQRDLDVTADILMLEEYIAKARREWTDDRTGSNFPSLRQIAKVAAIAVRSLERAGGSEQLLTDGLRGVICEVVKPIGRKV